MPGELRTCVRFDIGALLRHLRAIASERFGRLNSADVVLDGLGYRVVKIKIGGESLDEDLRRIEAVIAVVGSGERVAVDVNGRSICRPRFVMRARWRRTTCSGSRRWATRWIMAAGRVGQSLRPADGYRGESVLDAGCA